MSQKTQIELVKIKSWYIPADANSYRILRQLKMPLTKINRDFVPTMKLATEPRGITIHGRDFSTILERRLDQMGAAWKSKQGRTCKLTESRLSFTAPASDKNRKDITFIDGSFSKFCQRWGFKYVADYSERDDKIRLVIDYEFDPSRNPVLDLNEQPKDSQTFELELGFTKIKVDFMSSPSTLVGGKKLAQALPPVIKVEVMMQKGSDWEHVHTGTCVDQQIGDLSQFATVLAHLHERRALFDQGKEPIQVQTPKPPLRKEVVDQLKALNEETEHNVLALAMCTDVNSSIALSKELVRIARRIPRINAKMAEVGIDLVVTREMLVKHLDSAHAAWMHLFVAKASDTLKFTADQMETAATSAWPHVKAIKEAWVKAEFQDGDHAALALAKLAPIPGGTE